MKLKVTVVALILALSPTLAAAMCSGWSKQTASTCAEGQVYDADSASCVAPVSS